MGITLALSMIKVELHDGGRPKVYYECCALTSIFRSVRVFPSSSKIIENKCCNWRNSP